LKAAILAYHSQNIAGTDTSNNDHVALAADLDALHAAGAGFISLYDLVNGLFYGAALPSDRPLVCLTFDDGCDFDYKTLDFPGFGVQTGFLQIMEQFVRQHGESAQPGLHATSFVIADPGARQLIDQKSLFGKGHMSDHWWHDADKHPLMTIANHGLDHNHPDLEDIRYARGGFEVIDKYEFCHEQVVLAGELIEQKTGLYPEFFAYPFGESSAYMRDEYFPDHQAQHQSLAAIGTEAGLISETSNHWNLPRFVCGRDWSTPAGLLRNLSL
jgi:peptidoglycan/xylan/chitin deacetylase (PgdA/CDA1 family)